jgi:hypothetical protein
MSDYPERIKPNDGVITALFIGGAAMVWTLLQAFVL